MCIDKLFDIFSTRELSLLICIAIGLTAMLFSKNMRGIINILKLLFGKKIGSVLFIQTTYISFLVYLLYKLKLWEISLLKDTIFWYCSTALILLFSINKAKTNNYFFDLIKEAFKWTIAIEFIVNFYTFSLPVELLLVPIMFFLGMLQAYAKTDKKYFEVGNFFENVFAIIGIAILAFVTYKTFRHYQDLFSAETFLGFLLPPILTLLFIPFLYLLAVFINYEELFSHIDCLTKDTDKKKNLKREIFWTANIKLNRLTLIRNKIKKSDWYHSDNNKSYIKSLTE